MRFSRLRVLNFCRATHDFFTGLGYESRCVQYWQEPKIPAVHATPLNIFFWPRVRDIGWPTLKALLGDARPARVVIRASADPGQEIALPTREECDEYNVELVHGWMEKEQYVKLLTSCNVFVAPRMYEGIGQSFLEAMSHGMAVVAPDNPTMNEYISNGQTGYLYDPRKPAPIDFSRLQIVRNQALASATRGYLAWLEQKKSIVDYVGSEPDWRLKWTWFVGRLLRKHKWQRSPRPID